MLIEYIFYFLIAVGFLVGSSIYLVKSLSKLSSFLGILEFTAAFILMAFATSLPELFVGVSSAMQGNPSLSLGNILGAGIIDLTLIISIFIFLSKGIKFESKKVGFGVYYTLASILLVLILFLIGGSLSRVDGILLLLLFSINTYRMFRKKERYSAKMQNGVTKKEGVFYSFVFLISLIILFFASKYAAEYAILISKEIKISSLLVGLFFMSIATTLPELIFGINAILMKHREMSIGDQIGTVFTNMTLILGLVVIIHPITTSFLPFLLSCIFLLISSIVIIYFIKNDQKLDIKEGIFLLIIYMLFISIEILL